MDSDVQPRLVRGIQSRQPSNSPATRDRELLNIPKSDESRHKIADLNSNYGKRGEKPVPVASAVSRLPHLAPPVLTAYLDTNPANPRNQSTPRGYMIWLKSAGQALAREQRPDLQKQVRRELGRLAAHIRGNFAQSRGLVVFAGPDVWEELRLQVPVRDELHWGKPSLQQLAWVLDEHRVRGAVLVDPTGARFFRFWLGRVTEDEHVALSIDKSQWRIPHLVGPSTSGVSKQYGVQRNRVSAREQAQRERFASELAKRIARWMTQQEISPVVLVGEPKQIEGVRAAMAERSREQVVLLPKVLPRTSPADVQRELEPVLREWERKYEVEEVESLLSAHDPARAVLGIDETLHQLQRGRVRELVIARGLKGTARQCLNCGWVDRSGDPVCPLCGSERRSRTLRTVIPELASAFGVPMEIVAGDAATRLRDAGGIGAWLGRRKKPARMLERKTASEEARLSS